MSRILESRVLAAVVLSVGLVVTASTLARSTISHTGGLTLRIPGALDVRGVLNLGHSPIDLHHGAIDLNHGSQVFKGADGKSHRDSVSLDINGIRFDVPSSLSLDVDLDNSDVINLSPR